ncbi:unnamed protein product [Mycoplasma amphoriforme A39]|uniref:Uncharacterized protein n=2 Tax=Mycoplasma TaxID=2093 RepID=A0A292IIW6_9MOLU|nr:unnamed protein product [Mycoplasma amphoriforme A39]
MNRIKIFCQNLLNLALIYMGWKSKKFSWNLINSTGGLKMKKWTLDKLAELIVNEVDKVNTKIDKNHQEVNAKIDKNYQELNAKIDKNHKEVNDRIDQVEKNQKQLNAKIDKNYQELNAKIDKNHKEVNDKIDKNYQELNTKIDQNYQKLNAKIDKNHKEVNTRIDRYHLKRKTKYKQADKWMFGKELLLVNIKKMYDQQVFKEIMEDVQTLLSYPKLNLQGVHFLINNTIFVKASELLEALGASSIRNVALIKVY